MRWANAGHGRSLATPGASGVCPACNGSVLAKCGEIVSWHWAHKAKDCDPWSEPESEWHRGWKARFPSDWQECTIGRHRADVVTPIGVVEFQRSFLSVDEIRERESFYAGLIWVVDASSWALHREKRSWRKQDLATQSFRWSRPRKTWIGASRPVYLDTGAGSNHLFLFKRVEAKSGKNVAITQRMRKSDFLTMCYGLPHQLPPLLTECSSFDRYGEAVRRRLEVVTAARLRDRQFLAGLPLFNAEPT
jgi:competence protein CoiA